MNDESRVMMNHAKTQNPATLIADAVQFCIVYTEVWMDPREW